MAYMVYQLEAGAQGTPHLQGYFRLRRRRTIATAKTLLCATAHLERARGNEAQNRAYCTKEGALLPPSEFGEFDAQAGVQGARSDLQEIFRACQANRPLAAIATEWPGDFIRYHSGITRMHQLLQPPPPAERPIRTTILWGGTAVGKTHRVRTSFPTLFSIRAGRGPFDNYEGQEAVLFDEFRFEEWPISDMNQYCDKWPCTLNCRYNNKQALWNHVFICANSDPDGWWPNDGYLLRQAFFRRVNQIIEIKSINDIIIL